MQSATHPSPVLHESITPVPITVAHGDGIGPDIMAATLKILEAAGARLQVETIEIGEKVYERGHSAGIELESWDSLRRTKVFLKAPITTPQGGGFKSLNVTVRKTLGLYANVRPCVSYHPFVTTKHPKLDIVIVRENEEDVYAGIEHRQTDEVYQCLKVVSRPGTERIVRYAFEYAKAYGRKKVTAMTKDNIMKMTDGLFHEVFDQIGAEYPDIEKEHWIIDIGMARAANRPEIFDVIVTPNLYGDILSDVVAEATGSIGLAGSANIGEHCAMFEAIHGSAPRLAGQNAANPSGLILAGVMMLVHIGQTQAAQQVHNAWLRTLEDGIHTKDIYNPLISTREVGTSEFAEAVLERLGELPQQFPVVDYSASKGALNLPKTIRRTPSKRETVGTDVFVYWTDSADDLAEKIKAVDAGPLELKMITNRGTKVWPNGLPETFCTDHWRCRFMAAGPVEHHHLTSLLTKLVSVGLEFIKVENLCTFDGEPGFSLGQGQ